MCFCFDGENAVAAYRPDGCRERLPVTRAIACLPIIFHSGPSAAVGSLEPIDAEHMIELDPQNRAVQVRGFGNRLASLEERKISSAGPRRGA
ncbi:hypothetical protein [Mesorhizobium sp. STM 4661]|uniref:hypothetical protein n=1 Tax=Mesorhizobium sp. STM 4661 TaxID=1297570 RepID=UPI0002BD5E65|nr:hypothetical protein [Mesorhizobium sp. STM 4661]CCV14651.1 hypothetical protein MESS4_690042 [Mesorhizobium sp. STM 4661]